MYKDKNEMFINPLSLGLIIHIIDFVIRVVQNRIRYTRNYLFRFIKETEQKKTEQINATCVRVFNLCMWQVHINNWMESSVPWIWGYTLL